MSAVSCLGEMLWEIISPVYTGRLNRFRIRIKLNQIRVNTLIWIVNRFTQPTWGCGLNPGETRLVLKEVRVNSWCGF